MYNWDDCRCRQCGCTRHEWCLEREEFFCDVYHDDARSSGHPETCYGANCPCSFGGTIAYFRCARCGEEKCEKKSGWG